MRPFAPSLRALYRRTGMSLRAVAAKEGESVYAQYADYREPVLRAAGHRILAINRGEREEWLKVAVECDDEQALQIICRAVIEPKAARAARRWCARRRRTLGAGSSARRLEREIRNELTDKANEGAIRVFGENLHHLLMQPPIRGKVTLGVDPGFHGLGCKLAVVDETGKVLETGVGYFTPAESRGAEAAGKAQILGMIRRHGVTAIAIGNGTASARAKQFIAALGRKLAGRGLTSSSARRRERVFRLQAGGEGIPGIRRFARSAVSIARRMQDPLAELVKIDPKSIGVGQYQHDSQTGGAGKRALRRGGKLRFERRRGCGDGLRIALLTHVAGIRRLRWQHCGLSGRKRHCLRAQLKRCRSWGRRPLNSARASCAFTAAIRWTRRRFTRELCGGTRR